MIRQLSLANYSERHRFKKSFLLKSWFWHHKYKRDGICQVLNMLLIKVSIFFGKTSPSFDWLCVNYTHKGKCCLLSIHCSCAATRCSFAAAAALKLSLAVVLCGEERGRGGPCCSCVGPSSCANEIKPEISSLGCWVVAESSSSPFSSHGTKGLPLLFLVLFSCTGRSFSSV